MWSHILMYLLIILGRKKRSVIFLLHEPEFDSSNCTESANQLDRNALRLAVFAGMQVKWGVFWFGGNSFRPPDVGTGKPAFMLRAQDRLSSSPRRPTLWVKTSSEGKVYHLAHETPFFRGMATGSEVFSKPMGVSAIQPYHRVGHSSGWCVKYRLVADVMKMINNTELWNSELTQLSPTAAAEDTDCTSAEG